MRQSYQESRKIKLTLNVHRAVVLHSTAMISLKGRIAVVTEANEDIGGAVIRRLAAEGMKVATLGKRKENFMVLENELKSDGCVVKGYKCDVQIESDVKAAFKSIEEDLGAITVLINNAAVLKSIPLRDINLEDTKTVFNTNIIGVLSCTREALASIKNHSFDHGHIVNINSVAGHRDYDMYEMAVYYSSKRALTSLCQSFRNEFKSSKIRVTSISPALVNTTMAASFMEHFPDYPYFLPSDVADAVVYALSAPANVNVSEIILDNI